MKATELNDFLFDSGRRMAEQAAEQADFYRDMQREMDTREWAEAESEWQVSKDSSTSLEKDEC